MQGVKDVDKAIRLLQRQKAILEARERLIPFTRFTMPDFEDPEDVTRSAYDNRPFHDAIAEALEAVERGEIRRLILAAPPRHGKALEVNTPIPTPTGWTRIVDLRPGDQVFDETGWPCSVVAVSEVWRNRPVYKVTTDDGDEILADAEHEWLVSLCRKAKGQHIRTTKYLHERSGSRNALITAQRALNLPPVADLPVDPYVLGVWLGDGRTDDAVFTSADDFIINEVARIEGGDVVDYASQSRARQVRIGPHYRRGAARDDTLKVRLGVIGVLGNKRIPTMYARGSVEQRKALLQGLIDTDGYVAKDGQVEFCSTSEGLAEDVKELVHGLGHKASIVLGRAVLNGRDCGPKYRVMFYMAGAARLPRKAVKCRHGIRAFRRYIAVEPAGNADTVCIQVSSASHLFLAGKSMLPTHNSEMCVKRFAAWYHGRHPEQHIAVGTYGSDLAWDHGTYVRSIVTSPQFKQIFPDYKLKRGGAAKDKLHTTRDGNIFFVGRGEGLSGRGANVLIIDDILKDFEEARSQTIRDQAWNWFNTVAMRRLMGLKLVIIIMTRWHVDDLIGRLTDPENQHYSEVIARKWKIIRLPMIAEDDDDPMGRRPGELLWPERFDMAYAEELRAMDPLGFAALQQQRPTVADGTLFRRENVRFYNPRELPDNLAFYGSSDHAVGEKQRNDRSCFGKVGVDANDDIYFTKVIWDRFNTEVAVEHMLDMVSDNQPPVFWWAERGHISKSIGPFLYKRMGERGVFANIVETLPPGDKMARAQSFAARFAMGKVLFPRDEPWVERAISELMAFPNGIHDDFVDMCSLLGIGLQSLFRPGKRVEKKKEPVFGTLEWVKMYDEHARRIDERAFSRM